MMSKELKRELSRVMSVFSTLFSFISALFSATSNKIPMISDLEALVHLQSNLKGIQEVAIISDSKALLVETSIISDSSGMKGNTKTCSQVQVLDPKDPRTPQRGVLLWHENMEGAYTEDALAFTAPRYKGDWPEVSEDQDFCFIYVDAAETQVYCRFLPQAERRRYSFSLSEYLDRMEKNRQYRAMVAKHNISKGGGISFPHSTLENVQDWSIITIKCDFELPRDSRQHRAMWLPFTQESFVNFPWTECPLELNCRVLVQKHEMDAKCFVSKVKACI